MPSLRSSRAERIIFFVLAIANLFPLFLPGFFMTLDGASHLNNSRLLYELLSGNDLQELVRINPYNFTSYTGHLVLGLLNLFLPAAFAEKLLIAAIILGLSYAFRYLVRSLGAGHMILSWLVFPLTWSQLMYQGFYNFLLGVIFMLLILAWWVRSHPHLTVKKLLLLALLFLLAATSHVFMFVIAFVVCAAWSIWATLIKASSERGPRQRPVRALLKNLAWVGITALPGILILLQYLHSGTISSEEPASRSLMAGLNEIRIFRPGIAFSDTEQMFSAKWFWWLGLMLIVAVWSRLVVRRRDAFRIKASHSPRKLAERNDLFFYIAAVLLGLFLLTDQYLDRHLYIQDRLVYLLFVFLALWVALQPYPRWFSGVSVLLALSITLSLNLSRMQVIRSNGQLASEISEVGEHIPEGSKVYPINYSNNWLFVHACDYLAADRNLLLMENYQCDQGYFPLKWTRETDHLLTVLRHQREAGKLHSFIQNQPFDYLVTFAEIDAADRSDYIRFRLMLNRNYTPITSSENGLVRVYKPKKNSVLNQN